MGYDVMTLQKTKLSHLFHTKNSALQGQGEGDGHREGGGEKNPPYRLTAFRWQLTYRVPRRNAKAGDVPTWAAMSLNC